MAADPPNFEVNVPAPPKKTFRWAIQSKFHTLPCLNPDSISGAPQRHHASCWLACQVCRPFVPPTPGLLPSLFALLACSGWQAGGTRERIQEFSSTTFVGPREWPHFLATS